MNKIPLNKAQQQLITCLAWFGSRYALFLGLDADRPATRDSIEHFSAVWLGNFKEDWSEAFDELVLKNVLVETNGVFAFTKQGLETKKMVESEVPFFKYEYDHYFSLEKNSPAHARFCEEVYGMDLSQHGLIDQSELAHLTDGLIKRKAQYIADMGCGNGKITEWISQKTKAYCLGIDISAEAIDSARERTGHNERLSFATGNLNNFSFGDTFDSLLFLDTLYYVDNLAETLRNSLIYLEPNGHVYAYFSQWIMDEAYAENLKPDNTHLAKVLNEMNLKYEWVDLTVSGLAHWKRKEAVLLRMKKDFVAEGNAALWDYRYREAQRYAGWGDTKYARYFYTIQEG